MHATCCFVNKARARGTRHEPRRRRSCRRVFASPRKTAQSLAEPNITPSGRWTATTAAATVITDMPSRSRYNPPSSNAGGGRRSTTADVERSAQSSLADAAAKRVAQLHDEGDHIHCSEGNRVLLRQQNLDTLRITLKAEIAEDDWMYDEDPLVAASAATLSSVAASSVAMVQGVGGSSSRGDAGGADRAAVTAMYLERVAEQRATAVVRSRIGAASDGSR